MPYLTARDVSQEFSGVRVLDRVAISIELGTFHILAGENGAGKSTLVKILTGVQSPVEGEVRIGGADPASDRALFDKIAYVPQELTLFPNMTVAENLFMPFTKSGHDGVFFGRGRLERDAAALIERFHIQARPHQRVGDVAISDQQLLQIARAAARTDFKVLILDEPTSSLTTFETERLFRVLRALVADQRAVLFISHKMDEIFELGHDVTVLRNGRLVARSKMADVTERELVNLMAGGEVSIDTAYQPSREVGDVLLEVKNLSGTGFTDVSFDLRRGEILGFAGLVGAGRSELMQAIYGYGTAIGGTVSVGGRPWHGRDPSSSAGRGMMYLSEERSHHGIFPQMSLHDNIAVALFGDTARAGVVSFRREREAVAGIMERYGIRAASTAIDIRSLSGGNQQKAIIGRAIARRPEILIFDEPTKGIDVRTKGQIYGILKELSEAGIGIILVSSEITELHRCATRIVTMCRGRVTGSFDARGTDRHTLVSAILGLREPDHALHQ